MTMRLRGALLGLVAMATGSSAQAQAIDPTSFASAAEIAAQVAAMGKAMKPGQGFLWQPLVRDGKTVAALEYWKAPGRPAVHPEEAEYAIVIAGAGSLISGGTIADAKVSKPGLVEGSRIEGGTIRQLAVGDVLLIPAGTPHYFGVTGDRLVLLGIKLAPTAR